MNQEFLKERKLFFYGIIIALIICVADLYSKEQIFLFLDHKAKEYGLPYFQMEITGFFSLVKVWNKGVSFGMLNDLTYGKYILSALNIIITLILSIWLYRNRHPYVMIALALIIGGALGNLIDRLNNDAVADFLDFHLFSYHWPAFNLADSSVFIGVALLLLEGLFIKKKD